MVKYTELVRGRRYVMKPDDFLFPNELAASIRLWTAAPLTFIRLYQENILMFEPSGGRHNLGGYALSFNITVLKDGANHDFKEAANQDIGGKRRRRTRRRTRRRA